MLTGRGGRLDEMESFHAEGCRPWSANVQTKGAVFKFGYRAHQEFVQLHYHMGYTLLYAWVGHSRQQCPDICAYLFVLPSYMTGMKSFRAPNGDVGMNVMINMIAHKLEELASNPLVNTWYAGADPTSPTEITNLCEGVYGTGGGGYYIVHVMNGESGSSYNLNGIRRKFLV
eukprot:Gb_34308 [translate_table: standard]